MHLNMVIGCLGTRRRLTKQYGRLNEPEEPAPAEKITHGQRSDNDGKAMDDQSVPHGFTSGTSSLLYCFLSSLLAISVTCVCLQTSIFGYMVCPIG